jgi:hypothetical protein
MRSCAICGTPINGRADKRYCSKRCLMRQRRFLAELAAEPTWLDLQEGDDAAEAGFAEVELDAGRHANGSERIAWHRLTERKTGSEYGALFEPPATWPDDLRREFWAEVRSIRARRGG